MANHVEILGEWGREIATHLNLKFLRSTGLDPNSEEPSARLIFTDGEKIIIYRTDPTKITWVGNLVKWSEANGESLNIEVPYFPSRYLELR